MYQTCKIELSSVESYIAAYLHIHNLYHEGELESEFLEKFTKWYMEQIEIRISVNEVDNALIRLRKIKSIEIENGRIKLIERVWIKKRTDGLE